jgi:hypothetical protein
MIWIGLNSTGTQMTEQSREDIHSTTLSAPDQSETKLFRYIRLRQVGPNSYNHFLQLCNFELFGKLTGLTCA